MYIELLLLSGISIIICLLQKKKLSNVLNIEIKGMWFFFIAAIIQYISVLIYKRFENTSLYSFTINYYDFIICITYQLLLIGIILDINKTYMKILFTGTLLNFIVILANNCKMPVLIAEGITNFTFNQNYLESGKDLIHTIVNENTKLRLLCDIIVLKKPYPFIKSLSIGDIFLLSGIFGFWQEESRTAKKTRNLET